VQSFDIMLATLPCGDVVEYGDILIDTVDDSRIVVCPWCGDAYDQEMLDEWVMQYSRRPLMTLVLPLAYDGERLVKVVGMCSDGHPMVKECVQGAKVEHCRGALVSLRN